MPYRLFFGDLLLGEIEPIDFDFPGSFGEFRPSDADDRPELRRRIADYAASSAAVERTMLEQGDNEAWEARMLEHDARFLDLIASRDWWLEDDRGERSAILVPSFSGDSTVVWRWDFDR